MSYVLAHIRIFIVAKMTSKAKRPDKQPKQQQQQQQNCAVCRLTGSDASEQI